MRSTPFVDFDLAQSNRVDAAWLNAVGARAYSVTNIAALKLLPPPDGPILVDARGYLTSDDGGGGQFWWDAASVEADNGGTIIEPTAGGTGRWKRLYSELSVKFFGAASGGVTDASDAIQLALVAAAGKTLWFPDNDVFRVTEQLAIESGTTLRGRGELLIDYTLAGGSYAISAQGTVGSAILLTADCLTSAISVSVAAGHGLVAGDYVVIGDTRWTSTYAQQVLKVRAATATLISFYGLVGVAYTTGNAAFLQKLTPKTNITIRDLTIRGSSTSNIREMLMLYGVVNARVQNISVLDHRCTDVAPTSAALGIGATYCTNLWIEDNTVRGLGDGASQIGVSGLGIRVNQSSKSFTNRNTIEYYTFGAQMNKLYAGELCDNSIHSAPSGVRGIKITGVKESTVTGNRIRGFDTGIKVDDSDRNIIADNNLNNCGNNGAHGISLGAETSLDAASVSYNIVANNRVNATSGSGMGIYLDTYCNYTTIEGNNLFAMNAGGIMVLAHSCIIDSNLVQSFAANVANAGITFTQASVVANNIVFDSDNTKYSFATTGSFSAGVAGGGTFTGNVAYNNRIGALDVTENAEIQAEFALLAQGKNTILGLQWDKMYVDMTSHETTGTGEDDLATVPIYAGALGTTKGVHILAAGTKTGGGGNKTIKLKVGTFSTTFNAAANDTNDWRVELYLFNEASNLQRGTVWAMNGATPFQDFVTGSIDTSLAVVAKLTGECTDAGDKVIQTMFVKRYL